MLFYFITLRFDRDDRVWDSEILWVWVSSAAVGEWWSDESLRWVRGIVKVWQRIVTVYDNLRKNMRMRCRQILNKYIYMILQVGGNLWYRKWKRSVGYIYAKLRIYNKLRFTSETAVEWRFLSNSFTA